MHTMIEMSHNQYMKRTRVALVNVPKCVRKSLAHFGLGKDPLRAVYLGPLEFTATPVKCDERRLT